MTMPPQTTESDPWQGITGVPSEGYLPSRRVSAALNPNGCLIDWSISSSGNRALIVGYGNETNPLPMPHFKGMRIREDKSRRLLMLELIDASMRDVFLKVCLDLIKVLQDVSIDKQKQACVCRLECWSVFFRTERLGLSMEAQKGLIAELVCLEKLLTIFDENDVVTAWTGPDRAVHDFVFGQDAIEVKSNRGSGTPNITISSIDQLSFNEKERLFLFVVELNQSTAGNGLTLTQYVKRVRDLIASPAVMADFDGKLINAGYFSADDYSDKTWSQGLNRFFAVVGDFPRLDGSMVNPAISSVRYRVNLDHCGSFEITENDLVSALRRA